MSFRVHDPSILKSDGTTQIIEHNAGGGEDYPANRVALIFHRSSKDQSGSLSYIKLI